MVRLLIVGAGGFGREVLLYAKEMNLAGAPIDIGGFLDRNAAALNSFEADAKVLGDERGWTVDPQDRFVIAMGDPELRASLYGSLREHGAQFMNIIHPQAWIAPSAKLEAGIIVGPFASINADARVCENVAINSHVGVGHDTRIGRHSVISPFTIIAGGATVGENVFVGSSCVIAPKKALGNRATIAAGSVVYKMIPDNAMATGNPAVIHRNWRGQSKSL